MVKVRHSILGAASNIYREGGFFGLYKGLAMSCIGVTPLLAIKLSVFDWTTSYFKVQRGNKWFDVCNCVFGAFAGCCAITGVYPTDVIRRKMQLRGLDSAGTECRGMWDCMKKMYRADGLKGFYRGLSASYMKEIPSSALMFMLNERLKKLMSVV